MKSLLRILTLAASLMTASSARAGLILRVESFTATPGRTGTFEVTLQNTGGDTTLGAYQIQLSTDVAGLQFTNVDRLTNPGYVFPGASGAISTDFTPPFYTPPLTTFTATDFSASPSGFDTLAAGQNYGVLLVSYAVDPTASAGTGTIWFVSPGTADMDQTQLLDGAGNLASFDVQNGTVTLQSALAVPEPSGIVLSTVGLATLMIFRGATRFLGRNHPS